MSEFSETFRFYIAWTVSNLKPSSAIDILLVALIFYGILQITRGTQAVQLLRGVVFLILAIVLVANLFQLTAINWLIQNTFAALLVAIPVIFQPELRRGLERLGRFGLLVARPQSEATATRVINQICRAAKALSSQRQGALIVLEQEAGLQNIVETGVELDALVSADLLRGIFYPKAALHDGAVVIRGDRVVAAACVLPLARSRGLDRLMGTRHLAAVGITEQTDCIAVVVSEETGSISVAHNGRIIRYLDEGRLGRILHSLYRTRTQERHLPRWLSTRGHTGSET